MQKIKTRKCFCQECLVRLHICESNISDQFQSTQTKADKMVLTTCMGGSTLMGTVFGVVNGDIVFGVVNSYNS